MRYCILLFVFALPFSVFSQTKIDQSTDAASKKLSDNSVTTQASDTFNKVEVEASVDAALWKARLEQVLGPVIEHAASKRMKVGQYTVQVRFLVEKDGSISDVKALNDPGYGLAKGAVMAVKTGPNWSPGMVGGRKVRSYHTQPITFVISEN
jgi:protein TonB